MDEFQTRGKVLFQLHQNPVACPHEMLHHKSGQNQPFPTCLNWIWKVGSLQILDLSWNQKSMHQFQIQSLSNIQGCWDLRFWFGPISTGSRIPIHGTEVGFASAFNHLQTLGIALSGFNFLKYRDLVWLLSSWPWSGQAFPWWPPACSDSTQETPAWSEFSFLKWVSHHF